MTDHKHTKNMTARKIALIQGFCAWVILNIGIFSYMDASWWSRVVAIGGVNGVSALIIALFLAIDWDS